MKLDNTYWAQPSGIQDSLHIFGAFAFAVSQPIYSVLSEYPEFLIAHRLTGLDVLILVLVLSIGIPAFWILGENVLALVASGAQKVAHLLALTGLVAIGLLPLLRNGPAVGAAATITVALLLATIFAFGFVQLAALRKCISFTATAVLIFPIAFLFFTPTSKILMPKAPMRLASPPLEDAPPILMVVFDEFDTGALLNARLEIDAVRFPNFAALARQAHWFRRATSLSNGSVPAVPGILTGIRPEGKLLPTLQDHPQNLFTLLEPSYRMNVHESLTELCPPDYLPKTAEARRGRIIWTLLDLAVVYLHVILPDEMNAKLPSISHGWRDFVPFGVRWQRQGRAWTDAQRMSMAFVDSLKASAVPTLNFLHVILPHFYYEYLPSGKRYAPLHVLDGHMKNNQWLDEPLLVDLAKQRYLLQVGFVDTLLGQLLDQLRQIGEYDRSLILVTADHGVSFRSGHFMRPYSDINYPELLSVPLFIKRPYQEHGRIDDRFVNSVDIVPTLADVLNLDIPWDPDGFSVFDDDFPQRGKIRVYDADTRKQREYDANASTSFNYIKRQLRLYGSELPLDQLRIRGVRDDIVGRDVRDLNVIKSQDLNIELDQTQDLLKDIDLTSSFIPLYLSGRVRHEGSHAGPFTIGVAVNGTIEATTRTVTSLSEHAEFRVVLPESSLEHGYNQVEVYLIRDDSPKTTLLRSATLTPYRMLDTGIWKGR